MDVKTIPHSIKDTLSCDKLKVHVAEQLHWKFISFPDKNIAIDGVFEIFNPCTTKNGKKTGEHIWVEVKTGNSYLTNIKDTTAITLKFRDKKKFLNWKRIWHTVPGAMILVYVHYLNDDINQPIFYWVDLKNQESYVENKACKLRIPRKQMIQSDFWLHCKQITNFQNSPNYIGNLPTLEMGIGAFDYIKLNESLKKSARKQYRSWGNKQTEKRTNPKYGEVIISRAGWQHISRNSRQKLRIIQSWQLLTVAEEMIKKITYSKQIIKKRKWRYNQNSNSITFKEYYYLKARVKFNHRRETIVYVILRKITEQDCLEPEKFSTRVWFYSVYEGERGINKRRNQIS